MLEGFVPYPGEFVDRYRSHGLWLDRPLWELFAGRFLAFADRPAIVSGDGTLTYRELGERSLWLAGALGAALRIGTLDRVVLQLPNTPDLIVAYLALQRLGAIPIMALPAHREREIGHFLQLSDAQAYVCGDRALAGVVQAQNPWLRKVVTLDQLRALGGQAELPDTGSIDPLDPAVFLLSGGTTGLPKLIPRTHNDYWYNSVAAGDVNDYINHYNEVILHSRKVCFGTDFEVNNSLSWRELA